MKTRCALLSAFVNPLLLRPPAQRSPPTLTSTLPANRRSSSSITARSGPPTIIGLYKTELSHRRGPWRHVDAVEYATLEWVDWFNHRRLLEPIGNVPPAEFETSYYLSAGHLPMAA
jgi:transposase InsO family protein